MSIDIDDLPIIENARRVGRRGLSESALADTYYVQETPLNTVAGSLATQIAKVMDVAATVQQKLMPTAAQLSELQQARVAAAAYTQDLDCAAQPNIADSCDEACWGFPPDQMDPVYCGTCEEQAADPANNPSYNWHFVGMRGNLQLMDREPDVCSSSSGGYRDAWKWKVSRPCGDCAESVVYRCHDGFKKYPDAASWTPTICQGMVECDNQLTLCP